ncbi:MAG: putative metalloprotease CJM1_0395 family protein [Pseudomonadota bacterium]
MNVFGSVSAVPSRQYMAATRIEAKGLDRLVKDPAAALRRLGEQSLTSRTEAEAGRIQNNTALQLTVDRSLSAALMQQSFEEAQPEAAKFSGAEEREPSTATQKADEAAANEKTKTAPGELSREEQKVVDELRARDREVRAHEQAHKSVGGPYAGAISYSYQKGPDDRQYAIGGSVPIDMSPESTPEATIAKMRVVIAAALAPAEPSGPDRAIAQAAQAQMMQATADARSERLAEMEAAREASAPDRENDAASTVGQFAAGRPDNPYGVLGAIETTVFGERSVEKAA